MNAAAQDVSAGEPRPVARLPLQVLVGDRRVRYTMGVVALAALYRGAAEIGYALQFAGPVAAIVWLPVGIGAAFLYLGGLRYWPGVVVGDLLANDYSALPVGTALGQTAGNVLEVLTIAILLRALVGKGDPLSTVRGVGLLLVAVIAGTTVSATVGSLSSWLGDVIAGDELLRVWRTWWLGDASGALIILPLALAWARPPPRSWWRRSGAETGLMLLALVTLSELALRTSRPLAYLVFPALTWAALRLGQRGATLGLAAAACFAVWETTRQVGPFAYASVTYSVLSTQLYLAVAAVSTYCLSAAVAEREAGAERLAASRRRLVEAADVERLRIERNLHDGAQQRLTGLAVQLHIYAERARECPGVADEMFDDAGQELTVAIDELRELAHGIHPSALTDRGLADALRTIAMRSALPIHLLALPERRLHPTAEATAYFVVSEAMANTRKHANATFVTLRASVSKHVLELEIEDDGVGSAKVTPGSGLEGLRDRVEAIGGTLTVRSPGGVGTRISARIPASPLS